MGVTLVKNVTDLSKYDKATLMDIYEMMVRIRKFDENVIRLINEGKIAGFYHSGQGHEATAAGTNMFLRDTDCTYYHHRGFNVMIAKGAPIVKLFGDLFGRVIGTTHGLGAGIVHSQWMPKGVMGQSGTLGESFVLAPGTAYALKYKGTDNVVMCHNGDGTHAREVFHGGMNFAGIHKLPVIFICENNQWAISTNYKQDHSIKEYLAERAEGYNMPGYVVDGNDVLAVKEITDACVARARKGEGPSFIECITWRFRGHFEGDPYPYVDQAEVKDHIVNKDPIKLFKAKLLNANIATEAEFSAIDSKMDAEIAAAIAEADASPLPPVERIYEGLYSKELTAQLKEVQ